LSGLINQEMPAEDINRKKLLQTELPPEVEMECCADLHYRVAIPIELFVVASSADTAADVLASLIWAKSATKSEDQGRRKGNPKIP
jgi:hypothetical protein